mmetsp:Transcript_101761/g.311192  ORF Transcript_101761/g.311192 Transcript_101761/m.311192 type:complete len:209 (-) Transcript_101761:435-1061(-)
MVTSRAPISPMTRCMVSTGQRAPAMIPVRRTSNVKLRNSGWSSMAMYIVGTPYNDVHRSPTTALKVASASKRAAGYTSLQPCATIAKLPITQPKQWYKGTGTQMTSFSVYRMVWPRKYALLSMPLWVKVDAFGFPVVPLVNWMLIGSSQDSAPSRAPGSPPKAPNGTAPGMSPPTATACRRAGTLAQAAPAAPPLRNNSGHNACNIAA